MRRSFALMEVLIATTILAMATVTIWSHINSVARSYYLDSYALEGRLLADEMMAQWTAQWITHPLPFAQYETPVTESFTVVLHAKPYTIIRSCTPTTTTPIPPELHVRTIELQVAVIPPYAHQAELETLATKTRPQQAAVTMQKVLLCIKKAL